MFIIIFFLHGTQLEINLHIKLDSVDDLSHFFLFSWNQSSGGSYHSIGKARIGKIN